MAAIVLLAVGGAFWYVYDATGARARDQIDEELRESAAELSGAIGPALDSGPKAILDRADAYIKSQPFGPSSRVLAVSARGGRTTTNEPEVLGLRFDHGESAADRGAEVDQADRIAASPPGYADIAIEDAGKVRLLTVPVGQDAQATVRVAQPLEAAERAQTSVAHSFIIAGALAIAVALLGGFVVASRISRPLRAMAAVAHEVDAGELSHRIDPRGARDEVRALALSFNGMLDRLEAAFARQRDFVADASHELRTPLTVIRGQIEVLARAPSPSRVDVKRAEAAILEEVDDMDRLVDDLLLLARSESGRPPEHQAIDLERLLADQVESVAPADGRTLQLGSTARGTLRADRQGLVRVLRNLIGNALEHIADDGVVELSSEALGGERVRIRVDDDGPGIDPEERERVFDRFHRGLDRLSAGDGSGLGLAIARALVEAHSGTIRAESSPLGGARLVVELPGFQAARGSSPGGG